jgi:nucleoside-diphosphate-sugar epimerase
MRIFVTGATGFIGQHLVRQLALSGASDHVIALVRTPSKAAALPSGVEIFRGDLSTFADPATVLPASDVVVHLAGVIAADRPGDYDALNHVAVGQLIECLARQSWTPKRLVFASSLAAVGPSAAGHAWQESDTPAPIDAYGVAKEKAERLVASAPFPTTIIRPPIVLGPGDEASLTLFKAARTGVGFRVSGKAQELSFVDVRDLVDAFVLAARDERPGSFRYFASHPESFHVPDLWRELESAIGRRVVVLPVPPPILYGLMLASTGLAAVFPFKNQLDAKQYAQMVAPAFVCSSAKLRAELGWQPKYDLAETISNAAAGYRAMGWL